MRQYKSLKTRLFLAGLVAVLSMPVFAGSAQGDGLLGPLRLRDLTPFALQRLDFLPASAAADYPHEWAIEANVSYTNTFIMSSNVMDYLEARGGRAALGEDDFAALARLPEDAFYFDGSISVLNLTLHRRLADGVSGYLILPVHRYHGGSMDATIEGFHRDAGFSDFGRDLVAQDQFQGFFKVGDSQSVVADAPRSSGVADPVIGLRRQGLQAGDWDVVLEAALKLPLGANDPLFSSGRTDIGLQVSFQREWADNGVYLSLSHVYFAGSDSFGSAVNRHIPSLTAAWETRLTDRTSAILQATAARSLFKGDTDPELAANQYQLSLGLRHARGDMHYTFALTENVVNFNNTPDIGFHLGMGVAY